jgi:hypothetical protein
MDSEKVSLLKLVLDELNAQIPDFGWQVVSPPASVMWAQGSTPEDWMEINITQYKVNEPKPTMSLTEMAQAGMPLPRRLLVGTGSMYRVPKNEAEARQLVTRIASEYGYPHD